VITEQNINITIAEETINSTISDQYINVEYQIEQQLSFVFSDISVEIGG